jgi:hypothetical protein
MSDFRRRGFIQAAHGISQAARIWHGEAFSMLEGQVAASVNGHGPLPAANSRAFEDYKRLISAVAERLTALLGNGDLRSFYFNRRFGSVFEAAPSEYWSKPESEGMLVRLYFEASEIQSSASQPVPRESLYFSVGELAELLNPGCGEKSLAFVKIPLDGPGKKNLAAALKWLSEQRPKIRRADQVQMVRDWPEFRKYRITDRDLREAARTVPLPRGRHRKNERDLSRQ